MSQKIIPKLTRDKLIEKLVESNIDFTFYQGLRLSN